MWLSYRNIATMELLDKKFFPSLPVLSYTNIATMGLLDVRWMFHFYRITTKLLAWENRLACDKGSRRKALREVRGIHFLVGIYIFHQLPNSPLFLSRVRWIFWCGEIKGNGGGGKGGRLTNDIVILGE